MKKQKSLFDEAYRLDSGSMQTQIGKAFALFLIADEQQNVSNLLAKTENEIIENDVSDGGGIYKLAQAFATAGEKQAALNMFRRSVRRGFYCSRCFENDPLTENIRHEKSRKVYNYLDSNTNNSVGLAKIKILLQDRMSAAFAVVGRLVE